MIVEQERRWSTLRPVALFLLFVLLAGVRAEEVQPGAVVTLLQGSGFGLTGARSDLVTAPDGRVLIAWVNQTGAGLEIWYAVYSGEVGFLTAPRPLFIPSNPQAQRTVKVASTGTRFMIVWDEAVPGSPFGLDHDIRFVILDHSGLQLGAPVQANVQSGYYEQEPDCAGSLDGRFVVTWVRYGGAPGLPSEGIFARTYDENGQPLEAQPLRVDDPAENLGHQLKPSVAVWPGGGTAIVWQDGILGAAPSSPGTFDQGGSGIRGRFFDASLTPITNPVQINASGSGDQVGPSISAATSGVTIISFSSRSPGGVWDVFWRRFSPDGAPIESSDVLVTASLSQSEHVSEVSMTPSGEFAVAWSEEPAWQTCSAAQANPARIARYTTGGEHIETFEIEDVSQGAASQARPGVALDQWGNVYTAYESCILVGSSAWVDVRFRTFKREMIEFVPENVAPGGSVSLKLESPSDANHLYILLASLGTGPMPIDYRLLKLEQDILFDSSLPTQSNGVFEDFFGLLDDDGESPYPGTPLSPMLHVPAVPGFSGITLNFAFVAGLSSIHTISDTYSITIQ